MLATDRHPSIVIVGGGAAAVFLVVALAEKFTADAVPDITVVERDSVVGVGLAYGRADAHHLLNSAAARMSVSATDDTAFVRWCEGHELPVGPASFVHRRTYGTYLTETFDRAVAHSGGRLRSIQGEVVSVDAEGASVSGVTLADGRSIPADIVILALGNPPPVERATTIGRSIPNPWAVGALDSVRDGDRVLLVGTGLTMIDIAMSLARTREGIRMTATSRNLLLPRVHLEQLIVPVPGLELADGPLRLGDVVSAFGRHLRAGLRAGASWQAVADGVRPQLNDLWMRLSVADRRRALEHVSTKWNVHRHRMSPMVSEQLETLIESGTLTLERAVEEADFDIVINCTGPRPFSQAGWNPVVDMLLTAGLARPDELGIGLDADGSGLVRRADGSSNANLYTVGASLFGTLWETTAGLEIRKEATELAALLHERSLVSDDIA